MRIVITIFIFTFSLINITSQEVIATQGTESTNSASRLSYTIGEVISVFGSDSTNILTQGFQQPYRISATLIEDVELDFQVNIYPNPAVEQLNIELENYQTGYTYQLYDVSGKLLIKKAIESKKIIISFQQYSTGVYFLLLMEEESKKLKTYKVQKSH